MISPADQLLAQVIAQAFGLAVEAVVQTIANHRKEVALAAADLPKEDVHWEQAKADLARASIKKG